MNLKLKQDKRYSIVQIYNSSWLRVEFEGKMIAQVMNIETARQVIYREIKNSGGECEYLYDEDFE